MISTISSWLKRRVTYRRTYNELSKLSDRELYDLGISRGDIEAFAFETSYGGKR